MSKNLKWLLVLKKLENIAFALSIVLIGSCIFSLLARWNWYFDLFSHFTLQYVTGAFLLGIFWLALRRYGWAAMCLILFFSNGYELLHPYKKIYIASESAADAPILTMAQYNKLYRNRRYKAMRHWFEESGKDIDIIFIQESGCDTIDELKQFKDIFPYQYPESISQRFNDVSVLSRYPFLVRPVELKGIFFHGWATRVALQKPGFSEPVVFYSYHTKVPYSWRQQKQRNEEVFLLASAARQDESAQIIISGDWNITPYSPYFDDILDISGLTPAKTSWLDEPTWPSQNLVPFLKIPIDHVLYGSGLKLVDKRVGPALGSDHQMVITRFLEAE